MFKEILKELSQKDFKKICVIPLDIKFVLLLKPTKCWKFSFFLHLLINFTSIYFSCEKLNAHDHE